MSKTIQYSAGTLMVWAAWLLLALPVALLLLFLLVGGEEASFMLGLWILFGSIPTAILVAILFLVGRALRRPAPKDDTLDDTPVITKPAKGFATFLYLLGGIAIAVNLLHTIRFAKIASGTMFNNGASQHVLTFLFGPFTLTGLVLLSAGFFLARR